MIDFLLEPELLRLTVTLCAPYLIAALGELIIERSGVLNVAIEGMMMVGASIGFLATYASGNHVVGLGAAMIAGASMALVLAYYSVALRADQITVGLGLLVLGQGLSSMLYRAVIGVRVTQAAVPTLRAVPIPVLSAIPFLGEVLLNQCVLVYAALLLVPLVHLVLFATPLGLRLRAAGENPRAADSMGVNIQVLRYGATIVGGLLIGLAGAFLPLVLIGGYSDGMIGGRGWIALLMVILGRWLPGTVLGGALLFAYVEALQFKLAVVTKAVPPQFLLMLPYLVAIVVLVRVYRGAQAPGALAKPHHREERG